MDTPNSIADIRAKLESSPEVESALAPEVEVETPAPETEVEKEPEVAEEPAEDAEVEEPAEGAEEPAAEEPEEESEEDKAAAAIANGAAAKVTPDAFKYKVGGKEYEIPEKFRAVAVDEASTKELKELFELAKGMEYAKPYHQKTRERLETYDKEILPAFNKQNEIIGELTNYVKAGDYDSFFQRLEIDEKDIQKWMHVKINLTPEQQALYNQTRELQKQKIQVEAENQRLTQTVDAAKRETQEEQERQILSELDFTLNKSENKDRVQAYNAKHGENAFQNKVIQYAAFTSQTSKKDLSIEEAVKGVMEFIPPVIANSVAQKQVGGLASRKDKPVLPHIAAKAQSPAAKQNTSIKDIRAKYERMSAGQDE